jgi:tyrosine-protein kinase Etk/Wzc
MNNARLTDVEPQDQQERAMSLFPLLIVLAKRKKLILGLPLLAMITAAVVSTMLPPVFKATTKLLPPQQAQSGAAALLSQLGGMAGAVAGGAGLKNPSELYVGMLKSRTIADNLIQRFDLRKAYETELQEGARKQLAENTVITATKDGLISIDVEDKNKAQVAKLANAYVEELLKLTKVLAVTEAAQRRLFFERQLELSKNNLANAEVALKRALDTRGVVSVDVESRAMVETMGRLRAQISAKEIELSSMGAFVTTSNPSYRRAQEELNSLRGELARLENGRPLASTEPGAGEKQSGLENIKILRDVKYHQMLYELLAKQYEAARLDEAKDASVVQVLDPAVEPERRFKPQRALIVLVTGFSAFVLAILLAMFSEFKAAAMREPASAAKWAELKRNLLGKK